MVIGLYEVARFDMEIINILIIGHFELFRFKSIVGYILACFSHHANELLFSLHFYASTKLQVKVHSSLKEDLCLFIFFQGESGDAGEGIQNQIGTPLGGVQKKKIAPRWGSNKKRSTPVGGCPKKK
jgi:hypothetical protein